MRNNAIIKLMVGVINKLFYKKIKVVSNIYNYQINHIYEDNLDYKEKLLIHYLSPPKPLKEDYPLPFHGVPYYKYLVKIKDFDRLDYLIKHHVYNNNLYVLDIKKLLDMCLESEE